MKHAAGLRGLLLPMSLVTSGLRPSVPTHSAAPGSPSLDQIPWESDEKVVDYLV